MIRKSRNRPSPYGHHRHPVGPVLTTKYRKSIGNPRRRREFSQHDCATGVDPHPGIRERRLSGGSAADLSVRLATSRAFDALVEYFIYPAVGALSH
jgi:hypothetical protein